MFRLDLELSSSEEANQALADLDHVLASAILPEPTKLLLRDQLDITLRQIANQMSITSLKAFRVERTFEGDNYRVIIKARPASSNGPLKTLKRLLGRL